MRGYFGIGIYNCKYDVNYGSLCRTAHILKANYIFFINYRYKKQYSDTTKAWRHVPIFQFNDFDDFYNNLPYNSRLIGIEMGESSKLIDNYVHPDRAIYLLGAEDHGLPTSIIERCHETIKLESEHSFNVSETGAVVMYHRSIQMRK